MWNLTLYTAIIIIVSLIGSFAAVIFVISLAKLILLLCMKLMPHYFLNITKDTRNCRQNSDVGVSDINDFERIHQWLYTKLAGIFRIIPRNITNITKIQHNPSAHCYKKHCDRDVKDFLPRDITFHVPDSTIENDKLTNDSHKVNK